MQTCKLIEKWKCPKSFTFIENVNYLIMEGKEWIVKQTMEGGGNHRWANKSMMTERKFYIICGDRSHQILSHSLKTLSCQHQRAGYENGVYPLSYSGCVLTLSSNLSALTHLHPSHRNLSCPITTFSSHLSIHPSNLSCTSFPIFISFPYNIPSSCFIHWIWYNTYNC